MPVSGWNGRIQPTVTVGVFLGMITYAGMANILRTSCAVMATSDNGHLGGSAEFALGHPEKVKDFAYRAGHAKLPGGRKTVWRRKFYRANRLPLSFMNECGGGGRTAITEIQRYADDLDVRGRRRLPLGRTDSTHHTLGQMWVWNATHKDAESYIPPEKYSLLNKAALEACDANDGIKDGLIQDPTKGKFDPAILESHKNGDGPARLTHPRSGSREEDVVRPVRNFPHRMNTCSAL